MKRVLLYTLIVTTITVRFFTEMPQWSAYKISFSLLPRFFNFVDIMLFFVFAVFTLSYLVHTHKGIRGVGIGRYVILFTVVSVISILSNPEQIYWKAALSYILLHLEAIVFGLMIVNLNYSEKFFRKVIHLFMVLGVVQLSIALLIQIPLSWSVSGFSNPDIVSGTFGDNNSQLCFFLVLFTFLILGRYMWKESKRYKLLLLLPVFGVFYAAGYRAMWLSFPISLSVMVFFFSPIKLKQRILLSLVSILLAVFAINYMGFQTQIFKKSSLFSWSIVSKAGKIQVFRNFPALFSEQIHYPLVGVGPGAYCSRAFMTFAALPTNEATNKAVVTGSYVTASYAPPMAEKYTMPLIKQGLVTSAVLGSFTIDSPFTSYASTLAETGIIGCIFFFAIYYKAFKLCLRFLRKTPFSESDKFYWSVAYAAFGGLLFLLQMSLFDNWFSVSRTGILLWILLAILFSKGRKQKYSYRILGDYKEKAPNSFTFG